MEDLYLPSPLNNQRLCAIAFSMEANDIVASLQCGDWVGRGELRESNFQLFRGDVDHADEANLYGSKLVAVIIVKEGVKPAGQEGWVHTTFPSFEASFLISSI